MPKRQNLSEEKELELAEFCSDEFPQIFGMTAAPDLMVQHINGQLTFTVHYTPEMLCDLMDYYVLRKTDMALCMGVTPDCLNVLLRIKSQLPNIFNDRIGYATILLILGVAKYNHVNTFLKWLKYYMKKYKLKAPIEPYIYLELIRLLSLNINNSISYYWSELKPTRFVVLPSCFNKDNSNL